MRVVRPLLTPQLASSARQPDVLRGAWKEAILDAVGNGRVVEKWHASATRDITLFMKIIVATSEFQPTTSVNERATD